ncbi:MAG: PEF-CTERM sorting domain-containing protein [Methanosarcina sp.]
MKKILLLLVSGLLIVSMAGSAMAAPAQLNLTVNGGKLSSPLLMSPGTDVTVHVKCYDILYDWVGGPQHTRTITVSSADGKATFDIKPPSGSYSGSYASSKTASYQAISGDYEYDIKIKTTGFDKIIVNDTGVSAIITTKTDSGQEEFTTNVPEFPTVALPVAAILGLVFIFGRKKDGL